MAPARTRPTVSTVRGPLIVAVLFSSTAIAVGASQYAFGLFIVPLEEAFGWTRTEISASLSFAAVSGLASPLLGRAMDRFGARPIIVLSLAVFGVSFCLRPLMTELWHWYALSFLQYVAFSGMTVLPAGRLVATWFPRTRGRMTGITAAGNNVGGLVMPLFVAAALVAVSWSGASVVIGITSFAVAVAALFVIRESPVASERGQPADPVEYRQAAASALSTEALRATLRSGTFYAVLAAVSLGTFTYSAILPHALAHMVNKGMASASALSALGTIAVAGIGGKLLFGWLSDRFTARRILIYNLLGQAVFAAFLAGASGTGLLTLAAPLYGLFMGGFGALYILVVQESFDMRHFGSVMGLMNLGTVVSFGAGPFLAGVSYDVSGGYEIGFYAVCGLFVTGAAALWLGRGARTSDQERR